MWCLLAEVVAEDIELRSPLQDTWREHVPGEALYYATFSGIEPWMVPPVPVPDSAQVRDVVGASVHVEHSVYAVGVVFLNEQNKLQGVLYVYTHHKAASKRW